MSELIPSHSPLLTLPKARCELAGTHLETAYQQAKQTVYECHTKLCPQDVAQSVMS